MLFIYKWTWALCYHLNFMGGREEKGRAENSEKHTVHRHEQGPIAHSAPSQVQLLTCCLLYLKYTWQLLHKLLDVIATLCKFSCSSAT